MIDNISFTGIKNVSFAIDKRITESKHFYVERFLTAELSGRDLHKYRAAMKKSNLFKKYYENPVQKNFLHINTCSILGDNAVAINNNLLEVSDETIPMFSELARITRKIKNSKSLKLDNDYNSSKNHQQALFLDLVVDESDMPKYSVQDNVKRGANGINSVIQEIMENFFKG